MRILRRVMTVAVVCIGMVLVSQCARAPESEPVAQPVQDEGLAMAAVEIDGWRMEYEPEIYVGDSLFELINGGAEIYHRFGFVQALATQYADAEARSISLEVFEMGDVEGGKNIFADKSGGTGEPLGIGDESAGESYYLNFRTGRYLVTITGFDSEPETTEGILLLARAVADRLGGDS